jgi:DNA-binding response OmpR family regulator
MKRVLILEDDPAIARGLSDNLRQEHYNVETESDGVKGFAKAKKGQWDILILDVMLPGMDGLEICKSLRAQGIQGPILMLTGKSEEVDKVLGLELGADDYVTKPFSVREVLARIKALTRRQTSLSGGIDEIQIGNLNVNFRKQEMTEGKKNIPMTAKEFELLKYFAEHEGQVVSRDQILRDIWGYDSLPTTRTVDNYILSLRKKIELRPSEPTHLVTIHTVGYKFTR